MAGVTRSTIDSLPGTHHALCLDTHMVLEVAADRLIETILLGVELGTQFDRHEQTQTIDAPLPFHGEGDLIDVFDHGLDAMLR